MSLVLDGTLQTAQNEDFHKPIIELISTSTVADIPFDGQILQETSANETKPNVVMHSTGRLCAIYKYGTAAFKYVYTDITRTEFHWVDITLPANYLAVSATLCEMGDAAKNVGVILHCTNAGNEKLRSLVLSQIGVVVTAQAEVYSVATASHVLYDPFVLKLASGTYFLVYIDKTISGLTYYIRNITSADFSSWTAEATCTIGGLTATKRIQNTCLLQISTGALWCWFDYLDSTSGNNELMNIYYSIGVSDGSTWADATKFTAYATYSTVGVHPVAAQKIVNQIHAVYTEQSGALHMNKSDTGYCGEDEIRVAGLHFDSVARKIYCTCNPGTVGISCILRINIDTWTIDACWNTTGHSVPSVPALNSIWKSSLYVALDRCHSHGPYVGIVGDDYGGKHYAAILDADADTITQYNFQDNATYGLTKNISSPTCAHGTCILSKCYLDSDAKRLYLYFASYSYSNDGLFYIGYIDMAEPGPAYTLHEVVNIPASLNRDLALTGGCWTVYPYNGDFQVFPSTDEIVVSFGYKATNGGTMLDVNDGEIRIYTLSTGLLIKTINLTNNTDFPMHGLGNFAYSNGKIYGTFYSNLYPPGTIETLKSGLCIINLATNVVTYSIPTYATFPTIITYIQNVFIADSHRLLVCAKNMSAPASQSEDMMGMAVFDMDNSTWTRFNNTNVPGMDRQGHPFGYFYTVVAYDATNEMVITGEAFSATYYDVIVFNINGLIHQPVYRIGTYAGGVWTWTTVADLVQGFSESDAVIALENTDRTIYCFWVNTVIVESSLKWDKEGSSLDLSPYLVRGKEIIVARTIDGSPASISFFVSSGQLFDPYNTSSLYSIYLQKARKLTLRLGETVGGTAYWQNQSEFYVTETSLSYERLTHPVMEVKAEDIRVFWDEATIFATEYYETTPEVIIKDLITTWSGLAGAYVSIPTFVNQTLLYHQWVEMPLKDILDHIVGRYGYFLRVDINGIVTAKRITSSASVDHTYADTTKIINYSPDDSFSNFINQVVVTSESLSLVSVIYAEEPIKSLSGTVGWWGGKKNITVYYSEDRTKKCNYPRLEVLLSVKSFNFKLGGGGESISSYDQTNFLYCVVTINTPDLVAIVVGMIAAIVALGIAAVTCDFEYGKPGWCGIYMMALCSLLSVLMGVVASVASYQYQIYAQPYGTVKQTIQATWDDDSMQAKMGFASMKKLTEPLCYTIADCQVVADHEGDIVSMQRNRIRLSKITHLQDEEGDVVQFVHPYSGKNVKTLITNLTRRIMIPESSAASGPMVDDIEGWVI